MNVLITGIAGSGGSYLADFLVHNMANVHVHGLARWHSGTSQDNLRDIRDRITIHECDMNDLSSLIRVLRLVKPAKIFNMASHANVRVCFDTPLAVLQNNIMSTANLVEAIRLECPDAVLQQCSTSEVYGNPKTTPISESHPIQPVNAYAVSKTTQEMLCRCAHESWGLKVIITRAFAYINPRRRQIFSSDFARQIAMVEAGLQETVYHGNLDSIRTMMDVRDMVRAYWIASCECEYGIPYNIGSPNPISVGEFLKILVLESPRLIHCEADPKLFRPVDMTLQICDATKFNALTGFKPQYSIEESTQFLLNHVREEVGCLSQY